MSDKSKQRVDYGIDAPGLVRMFFLLGLGVLVAAVVLGFVPWIGSPWKLAGAGVLGLAAAYLLGMGGFMLHGSKVGKLKRRERLLDLVPWKGNERVLDVGCGRGLMLIGAAKRLTTGKAVGVDLWRAADQSGNNPEATARNARLEGVADRVDVQTSDMRSLPFGDATFGPSQRYGTPGKKRQKHRVISLDGVRRRVSRERPVGVSAQRGGPFSQG